MHGYLFRAAGAALIAFGAARPSIAGPAAGGGTPGNLHEYRASGRSVLLLTDDGSRLRITPYGPAIVRVQTVRSGEEFFPDDRYEMVERHDWPGSFRIENTGPALLLSTAPDSTVSLRVNAHPVRIAFSGPHDSRPFLTESGGVSWTGGGVSDTFLYDSTEHFTALGHGFFGRADALDLKGTRVGRNYGNAHGDQAPLIVPFYLSSRGYGVFLNSTYPNSFSFGRDGVYGFGIEGDARLDYFVIAGPSFASILDRYTQLTGRPRLPPIAVFGLGLSDKGNDESSSDPSDEAWWKRKVEAHRDAGFPIDHLINDNRWRAGGGKRCDSYFAWDSTRFPDPAGYGRWVAAHGLFVTIDFNRCIAERSDGWKSSFNIPVTEGIDHAGSAPDFTRPDVRQWFWNLHWTKTLDPSLGYPGDALWIDEFDELGKAPPGMRLGDGRTWQEMKNYWFFLIAKALVQEGWDPRLAPHRRPFVWVRGMTAGAQRYATLWSGDIRPTYADMEAEVRGMQLAGLSGFPYWGHDAGGFHDWEKKSGPDELMYRRWSMAMGSFSPFWKPHGMGLSRWPLDRSPASQQDARTYTGLRYGLLPYTYTCAHQAAVDGMPLARAMLLEYPDEPGAWKHDLQYMWGPGMLVAPNCSDRDSVTVWFPRGGWIDFWDDARITGGATIRYAAPGGKLPLFVKTGAILPMAEPALSTSLMSRDTLIVQVYTGADGSFALYEDDGKTEGYRAGAFATTQLTYADPAATLSVAPQAGEYAGAPERRTYIVVFHGLGSPMSALMNGTLLGAGAVRWEGRRLTVSAGTIPVHEGFTLALRRN